MECKNKSIEVSSRLRLYRGGKFEKVYKMYEVRKDHLLLEKSRKKQLALELKTLYRTKPWKISLPLKLEKWSKLE